MTGQINIHVDTHSNGSRVPDFAKAGKGVTTLAEVQNALRIREENRRTVERNGRMYGGGR